MDGQTDIPLEASSRWELAAYLIRDRKLGLAMAGGGLFYLALTRYGWDIMPCPSMQVLGLPCPGCGMTRSCLSLLRGDWAGSLRFNPFGPVFAVFWAVVGAGVALPQPWRGKFADYLGRLEQRSRWAGWVAGGLAIYSLTRLIGLR